MKSLMTEGPHVKPQKVKRVPGSSGRLHKTADGDWEWSDEEMDKCSEEARNIMNSERSPRVPDLPAPTTQRPSNPSPLSPTEEEPAMVTDASTPPPAQANNGSTLPTEPINLVLRLRNERKELNDIKFDFTPQQDTPDSVSRELVEAGLVDGKDMIVVAANLQKIIDNPPESKSRTFALNSGCGANEVPDDKALIGFAQLTISDGTNVV